MTFWRFVFWAGVLGLCLVFPPLFLVLLILYALKKMTDDPQVGVREEDPDAGSTKTV